jgi:hypothetical protein
MVSVYLSVCRSHTNSLSHTQTHIFSLRLSVVCMSCHSLSDQGLTAADMPMVMEAARQCPRLTYLKYV